MYNGSNSSIDLTDVIKLLVQNMDKKNALSMIKDLQPGPRYIAACDNAYTLYDRVVYDNLSYPIIWDFTNDDNK